MKTVTVRDVVLGEGMPKICVPIVAATHADISLLSAEKFVLADMIEWRMDHYQEIDQSEQLLTALKTLRASFPDKPLLATFRTKEEGGERKISCAQYAALLKTTIASKMIDLIDIEHDRIPEQLPELISFAHQHQVSVLLSNHQFYQTPSCEDLVSKLCAMQKAGGDIVKMAVMPKDQQDVLTLMNATLLMKETYADRPVVTMSMGRLGLLSRISGELYGSAISFGIIEQASAPGQLPAQDLALLLQLLHKHG